MFFQIKEGKRTKMLESAKGKKVNQTKYAECRPPHSIVRSFNQDSFRNEKTEFRSIMGGSLRNNWIME